jgi:hypothetical protein
VVDSPDVLLLVIEIRRLVSTLELLNAPIPVSLSVPNGSVNSMLKVPDEDTVPLMVSATPVDVKADPVIWPPDDIVRVEIVPAKPVEVVNMPE